MFWASYLFLSILISYFISKLVSKNFLKIIFFSLFFSLFTSVWFISKKKKKVAPIFSIFLLEVSILENNGLERLFRPLLAIFFISLSISFVYTKIRSKN